MAELNARVALQEETRDELRALKDDYEDAERYEDVICRLIREHKENA